MISVSSPVRMTRSAARAAGSNPAPAISAANIAARTPSVDKSTPIKRGPGRPPGAKNKKPAQGKGKGKGKGTQPLRDRVVVGPDTEMAGPLPVAGGSSGRSGPFVFPMPVPPIDVDGLERAFTHDVLVRRDSINFYSSNFFSATSLRRLRLLSRTRFPLRRGYSWRRLHPLLYPSLDLSEPVLRATTHGVLQPACPTI